MGGSSLFAEYRERPQGEPREDAPGQLALRPAHLEDLAGLGRLAAERDGGPAGRHVEAFRRALEADPERGAALVLVATLDDALVAYGKAHFHAGASGGESPHGWYLSGVIVDPRVRRRGIGGRLTAQRLAWIARQSDWAYYFANARNRASIALHAGFGFAEIARGPEFCGVAFTGGEGVLFAVNLRGG